MNHFVPLTDIELKVNALRINAMNSLAGLDMEIEIDLINSLTKAELEEMYRETFGIDEVLMINFLLLLTGFGIGSMLVNFLILLTLG